MVVGTWAGNNDNSPMVKKVAGLIVAPMWHEVMQKILPDIDNESFVPPQPVDPNLKPVLRGDWQAEYSMGGVHDILYWVKKSDPTGPAPSNPSSDAQYANWEYGVQAWLTSHPFNPQPIINIPQTFPLNSTPYYLYPGQASPTPVPTAPSNPYGYIMTPNGTPQQ